MNETILNLAVRTAVALKLSNKERVDIPEMSQVSHYFTKLGIKSGFIKQLEKIQLTEKIIDELCIEINNTLCYDQKIYLLLLIQDCLLKLHDIQDFITDLTNIYFLIGIECDLLKKFRKFLEYNDPKDIDDHNYLVLSPQENRQDEMLEGRWIEDNAPQLQLRVGKLELDEFRSHVLVMFIDQIKTYVVRCLDNTGRFFDDDIELQCRFRLLAPGGELCVNGVPVVTFSDIKNRFLHADKKGELVLAINHIQYHRPRETKGIDTFSAVETTGRLIGIVGREGIGKSTLLKLLAGKIKPDSGTISINGYDLWKNKYMLKGIIGYVPEEDLLFEELTVADNLTLTARLYYSNLSGKEIELKVNAVLSQLDLLELKHVVVGDVLSKHIQPGQRRMINIALELLREPQILLVDNSLSGLGMADASKVIKILHDYSFLGNLVITSISQADSETFLLFDKIWIFDEYGSAVYNGFVKSAPEYLNRHLKLSEQKVKNIDPSMLLDLVNYKLPDKIGHVWKRVMEPKDWHNHFINEQLPESLNKQAKTLLPARILKIPNLEIQLLIFSIRNFKCKFSRINDIIRVFVAGPVVALLISLLFRTGGVGEYHLSANANLSAYQFISLIIMLLFGLILSADEIVREKNIIEKEDYLEFSRFSYLNSKILYLFPVIAIQSLLYVMVGNYIMGIREMLGIYWLVLFSTACFGITVGLVFSSGVRSNKILIKGLLPFVIAVQFFLGGGIIPFDTLNLGNGKYTPLLSDLMVSRWGYEALAVEQFENNKYEKLIYKQEKKLDQSAYYNFQLIPKLEETLSNCEKSRNPDSISYYAEILENELVKIESSTEVFPFEYANKMQDVRRNPDILQETRDYITYLSLFFYEKYDSALSEKDRVMKNLTDSLGKGGLKVLYENYHNDALANIVTGSFSSSDVAVIGKEVVRTKSAIFQEPQSNFGRARLFTPVKMINGRKSETLWFNISMIWFLTAACYLLVLFDVSGLIRRLFHMTDS
jgi:ABC transport system ATP-binding/permease protein